MVTRWSAAVAIALLPACGPALAADVMVVETEPSAPNVAAPTRDVDVDLASLQPLLPEPSATIRVVVMSDLNSRYGSVSYSADVHAATRTLVDRIRPDLVLITGDMVAGQKAGLDYPAMWRGFHAAVTDPLLAAGIVVAPTPGNHDAAPGFARERKEYVAQWTDARRATRVEFVDDSRYPITYSFTYGGAFFASIDATAVGPLDAEQRAWLDDQLSRARPTTKIVFGHLPNHPFAIQREKEILDDPSLEEILRRHGVAAYLSGHHHAYFPGAVRGVRHVAMPCLGSGPRRLIGESQRSRAALVVMDVDASGIATLEALQAPDFQRTVARDSLPTRIVLQRHSVVRDDLAGLAPSGAFAAANGDRACP